MFQPIKELGQNFLKDTLVARDMVDALGIQSGEEVIEIGAGHGILTQVVADKIRDTGATLYAVEVDERLCAKLNQMFLRQPNVKIVCEDILRYLPEFEPSRDFKILGSLPYYITSPIIHKIIKMKKRPLACVLLVQKEVAERIVNKAPDSTYLSSFIQTFFNVEFLNEVPRKMFTPEPEVDGGVIRLTKKDVEFGPEFIEKYEGFLHKAFSHPRKMLNKVFPREELQKQNIDPTLRAQNLNADNWLEFFHALHSEVNNEV